MDTTPTAGDTLLQPLVVALHRTDSCSTPMAAQLSYQASDPYALTLRLHRHGHCVPWLFARSLLSRGLTQPTGDGDVHIWPDHDDDGHAIITVELSSRYGHALVDLQTTDAKDFIERTNTIVAPGYESRHLDLDATIAAITATEIE